MLRAAVLGFVMYYSVDFFVHRSSAAHVRQHGRTAFASFAALGLTVHSFLDGFAIGSAFQANSRIGALVAIAVITHDFGDGVSTVGIVLEAAKKLEMTID